ncbi:hypothetical protein D9M71_764780 [compost metagenome]
MREKYRSGTEAMKASGNCATPQIPAQTSNSFFDDTRLATKPKPMADIENSRKKLLAIMPNSAGESAKSAISGTATIPRIALSMKLIIMNTASRIVMIQACIWVFFIRAISHPRIIV